MFCCQILPIEPHAGKVRDLVGTAPIAFSMMSLKCWHDFSGNSAHQLASQPTRQPGSPLARRPASLAPLRHSAAPPLHNSTTPPLHHSTTPPLHHSNPRTSSTSDQRYKYNVSPKFTKISLPSRQSKSFLVSGIMIAGAIDWRERTKLISDKVSHANANTNNNASSHN
jgi:hypothetical protein